MLSEQPRREADRTYNILTREFGLIKVAALGVRKEASKLRGALEPFILSSISLVRGKEYWRATSAESIISIPSLPAIARPMSLLEKLIQGEAPHPELFDSVEQGVTSSDSKDTMFEVRLVSKILYHLGYLKKEDLTLGEKNLIKAVNEGIQASHL